MIGGQMAWIKMRTNLLTDPKIVFISARLQQPRIAVIGACYVLWSLADSYTTDGKIKGYAPSIVDEMVGIVGFCDALFCAGWLNYNEAECWVEIPRFDEHNSQSAKARAQTALRVAKHRNARSVTQSVTREEKKREEKTTSSTAEVAVADDVKNWALRMAKRPDWLPEGKPWIDAETWVSIAIESPHMSTHDLNKVLIRAKQGRNTLANPAGFIISKLKGKKTC
jgi:hypothetical protein